MNEQHCDQCENQFPVDALQCGKGRKHFGLESSEHMQDGHGAQTGPLALLRQCGHMLHHGGIHSNEPLSALNAQEQAELERLLGLLLSSWKAAASDEPTTHGENRFGRSQAL